MVTRDHIGFMKKVGIAQLKAHLSEHIRSVRNGGEVLVMDRGEPVARLVPLERKKTLIIHPATRSFASVELPPPPERPVDSLAALLEERGER